MFSEVDGRINQKKESYEEEEEWGGRVTEYKKFDTPWGYNGTSVPCN